MADEKSIADFISITNSNRATAIRCLSKANGDVEGAVSEYFNTEGAGTSGGGMVAPVGVSWSRESSAFWRYCESE